MRNLDISGCFKVFFFFSFWTDLSQNGEHRAVAQRDSTSKFYIKSTVDSRKAIIFKILWFFCCRLLNVPP